MHHRNDTLVAGIQPTGIPHIGNYLGMLRGLGQRCSEVGYSAVFVADIHATTAQNYNPVHQRDKNLAALKSLLACGIPAKNLFVQSDYLEHFSTGLIIQHLSKLGRLERMSQFRTKSDERGNSNNKSIPLGLLTYPCLMAADIILHASLTGKTFVPSGPDQFQHLVFASEVAEMLNKMAVAIGDKPFIGEICKAASGPKIAALKDTHRKMSKSSPADAVFLDDDRQTYTKKYKSAVTGMESAVDQDFSANPLGVRNLVTIYAGFKDMQVTDAAVSLSGINMSSLKEAVISAHAEVCDDIARRMAEISDDTLVKLLHEKAAENGEMLRRVKVEHGFDYIRRIAGLGTNIFK